MFSFLFTRYRTLVSHRDLAIINTTMHWGYIETTFVDARLISSSLHVKKRSVKANKNEQKQSFMVSFLMNSCGLSLESAISASKKVKLKNTEKADSVLRLLRDHGFTSTQISQVIRLHPRVLVLDPDRIILPKIEFFRSIGFSRNDLANVIAKAPVLLSTSLQNRLTPNYNCLKNVLILDEKVVRAFKGNHWLFSRDVENLTPNIALLIEIGVPECRIPFFVIRCPSAAICKHSQFCNMVNKVKEMGFNPSRITFIFAIEAISQLKKSVWESKIEVYGRWGWSRDEILVAFRRHPHCMLKSEEKITRAMDFFVNKMGWLSKGIAKMPILLLLSLEKRIAPRCSVVQVLLSKGLIREGICPTSFLLPREEVFMARYVTKFQEKVPLLLNVYQGKNDFLKGSLNKARNCALCFT